MNETIPKYIIDLEERLGKKINGLGIEIIASTSNGFTVIQKQINSLEDRFDTLEDRFDNFESRFNNSESKFDDLKYKVDNIEDTMATKLDVKEILVVIGSYEVRSQNVEQILLKDHKPRIIDLEKEVFT